MPHRKRALAHSAACSAWSKMLQDAPTREKIAGRQSSPYPQPLFCLWCPTDSKPFMALDRPTCEMLESSGSILEHFAPAPSKKHDKLSPFNRV